MLGLFSQETLIRGPMMDSGSMASALQHKGMKTGHSVPCLLLIMGPGAAPEMQRGWRGTPGSDWRSSSAGKATRWSWGQGHSPPGLPAPGESPRNSPHRVSPAGGERTSRIPGLAPEALGTSRLLQSACPSSQGRTAGRFPRFPGVTGAGAWGKRVHREPLSSG